MYRASIPTPFATRAALETKGCWKVTIGRKEFGCLYDLEVSPSKRSHRVRSWYLYEQFKSLERNQLDAARKLKDRSYQDRILRQELSERKVRRNLYDKFGLCHSESRIERSAKSEGVKTDTSVSTIDFYEIFSELQDSHKATDNLSGCSDEKIYEEDFKSTDENQDYTSYTETVNSVVNIKSEETITEDIEKQIDGEDHTVAGELNLYFDEVKDNLERIEKLTELKVDEDFECDSLYSIEENDAPVVTKDKHVTTCDNKVFAMWSYFAALRIANKI
ncbi:Uncharacterized protein OBRU01_21273 [Operophtera brumata]|uniref:Uncharacterized protein n=1 Tax=Operophtera brumata TaxID=104452 RepID=A0A0L7KSY4_OPEBR|nr:Uncharacterized protein OBRU01_21273 [Operophtera brumata]